MNNNIKEEVYSRYFDSAGNFHWIGTKTGHHIIYATITKPITYQYEVITIRGDNVETRSNL